MKIILGILLLPTLATFARARLGETPAQISARFGPGTPAYHEQTGQDTGLVLREYQKHGFVIMVLFTGVSVGETYETKIPLSQHQIEALLADNSGGYRWKETPTNQWGRRLWVRSDGATARLRDREFEFKSRFLINHEANFEKSQIPSVQGF